MQCVILAGGLGTRMHPWTQSVPKNLIPIHGIPFVDYQLKYMSAHGIKEVIFCIGYKGSVLKKFLTNGGQWNLSVKYVDEGETLMGTGGAIRKALDSGLLESEFIVTYGDSYLPINYALVWSAFKKSTMPALMTVIKNNNTWDKSNVCLKGKQVSLYSKALKEQPASMNYIDYGMSVFQRSIITEEIAPNQKYDLSELFYKLSIRGRLAAFQVENRFYEIGSLAGLRDFEAYLSEF